MNVARILFPVKVLGPGDRVGIWLCGCKRCCVGCSNPELWDVDPEKEISVQGLVALIDSVAKKTSIDGITITGGEPFEQAHDLTELLNNIDSLTDDILVYTGFTLTELKEKNDNDINNALDQIGVLIDGPYEEERNDGSFLKGSSNQKIHILKSILTKRYEEYMKNGANRIQNFSTRDGVISVGIHEKNFQADFESRITRKGVEIL